MKSALALMLTLAGYSAAPSSSKCPEQDKGMWVWDESREVAGKKDSELLEFSSTNDITQLFLNAHPNPSVWKGLVRKAHDKGIEVHALSGNELWINTDKWKDLDAMISKIESYNESVRPQERYDAFHFDIEPHRLSGWKQMSKGEQGAKWVKYLRTIDHIRKRTKLPVYVDFPVWTDTKSEIVYKGKRTNWYDPVLKMVDGVYVMAYRVSNKSEDSAKRIITDSNEELDAARRFKKKIFLAVETKEMPDKPNITYFGRSLQRMNSDLGLVQKGLRNQCQFRGVAIHQYESFKRMRR